jgi:hypothetical protein
MPIVVKKVPMLVLIRRSFLPSLFPAFRRSFTALTDLETVFAKAQKKQSDLTKLTQQFDDLLIWLNSVANVDTEQHADDSNELLEKVKAQKEVFAKLRQENAAKLAELRKQIDSVKCQIP